MLLLLPLPLPLLLRLLHAFAAATTADNKVYCYCYSLPARERAPLHLSKNTQGAGGQSQENHRQAEGSKLTHTDVRNKNEEQKYSIVLPSERTTRDLISQALQGRSSRCNVAHDILHTHELEENAVPMYLKAPTSKIREGQPKLDTNREGKVKSQGEETPPCLK